MFPLCHPNAEGERGCGWNHSGNDVGKAPRTSKGNKGASIKTEAITADIWNIGHKLPDANIGIDLERAELVIVAPTVPNGMKNSIAGGYLKWL